MDKPAAILITTDEEEPIRKIRPFEKSNNWGDSPQLMKFDQPEFKHHLYIEFHLLLWPDPPHRVARLFPGPG